MYDVAATYVGIPAKVTNAVRPAFAILLEDTTYLDDESLKGQELRKLIRQFSWENKSGPRGIKGGAKTMYTLRPVAASAIRKSDKYNKYRCKYKHILVNPRGLPKTAIFSDLAGHVPP